ncbi:nitrate ABC transporter permease [Nocardioides sp. Root1257]|uniref:ABC transporter permease n=1 Tax=unclassified Nocardioides TaxID=2615069 RepID=UPI000701B001|nr:MULTISPECIES: ABC transporter permease subunit [unclassified Nocardioides]KQW46930.1 nitrate ABC transporter permease [Nocardioides sp. Root1257]KRC43677.1 nitrate ABC transporter permease [Nocardioides sp. Root224]
MRIRHLLLQLLKAVALPIVLVTIWWVASADSTSFFWPPLSEIVKTFPETWDWDRIQHDVLPSLARLAIGYTIALVVGVALGSAIGLSRTLRAFLEPTLEFFRAIPPPILVPVIAVFAGYTGWTGKIITIALGCLWPILLNAVEGVRGLDEVLVDTARSYRLRRRTRFAQLVLRGSSPQVAVGARQALSIGVIVMVISELFGANRGLGASIVQFQRSFAIPQMWTGIILLGLIGFALSVVFRIVEHYSLAWYRGLRQADRGA